MSNAWGKTTLGETCKVVAGFGFPIVHQGHKDKTYPFFKVSDMNLPGNERDMQNWNNTVDDFILEKTKACTYPPGTVIFPKIGMAIRTNKKRRLVCEATFDNNVMGLVPTDKIDSLFLYWFVDRVDFFSLTNVTAVPALRKSVVEKIPLLLPPLPVQKKIAAILEKADQARRKRQETLRLSDQFLQAAFLKMFGDSVTNPKEWKVKNVEAVCHKVTDGTHDTPKYVENGIPLITSKNLLPAGLDFSSALFISPEDHEEIIKRSHSQKGDILFAMIGTIGNASIVSTDTPFSIKNVALFKPDKKQILSSYLLMVLRSASLMKKLLYNSKGGTQKFVALGPLRAINLPVPPLSEQQKFEMLVEKVGAFLEKQRQSEQELEPLFQSLMQKAFRGDFMG